MDGDWLRRHRVAKADVNLQRYASLFEPSGEVKADAIVLRVFLDQFGLDGVDVELNAVFAG